MNTEVIKTSYVKASLAPGSYVADICSAKLCYTEASDYDVC